MRCCSGSAGSRWGALLSSRRSRSVFIWASRMN